MKRLRDWRVIVAIFAAVVLLLFLMGCASNQALQTTQERINTIQDSVNGVVNLVDQIEQNTGGGDLPPEMGKVKTMLAALNDGLHQASSDISKLRDLRSQEGQTAAGTAIGIGSMIAGPYAPVVTAIGALFGVGGVAQARRKKKEADAVKVDLESLATTLVNVAGAGNNPGVIDTSDDLTKARLDNMTLGASTAIRKAQGKKV